MRFYFDISVVAYYFRPTCMCYSLITATSYRHQSYWPAIH